MNDLNNIVHSIYHMLLTAGLSSTDIYFLADITIMLFACLVALIVLWAISPDFACDLIDYLMYVGNEDIANDNSQHKNTIL